MAVGDEPINFVLTGYLTEAAARNGDTSAALKVKSSEALVVHGLQAANYHFFTHEKYWFRIESNEPVLEFYIDWDDGEDNDPKGKANFSLVKFDNPQFVGIISHIFTRDKAHYPKIRVKSIDGYLSKFYTPNAAAGAEVGTGIDILQGETALAAGRNNKYRIEADSTGTERIPIFAPAPKSPIGILKSDKKRIYAGINNGYLVGKNGTFNGATVYLNAASSVETNRTAVLVRITHQTSGAGDITYTDLSFGGTSSISDVVSVLRIELLDHREASSTSNTNKLGIGEKIFLTADSTGLFTLGEVSLGNPIIELESPRHSVIFDATESYARTPDQSISYYYLDDGKGYYNQGGILDGAAFQAVSTSNISDEIQAGTKNYNKSLIGIWNESYSFEAFEHWCDDDGRFLPYQILARTQVETGATAVSAVDANATYIKSPIEHWIYDTYNVDAVAKNWVSSMKSSNLLAYKNMLDSDEWSNLYNNNSKIGQDPGASTPNAGTLLAGKYELSDGITNGAGRFGAGGAAKATITITDYTELNTGDKVNLIATDTTNYDFTNGDQSSVAGTWESTTSNNATATNLMNVINTSSGPSGTRFTATVNGAVVTATQATGGVAGNTTVTLTDTGTAGMSKTNFTSGPTTSLADTDNQNFLIIARDKKWDNQFWHIRRLMAKLTDAASTVKVGDKDAAHGHMNVRANLFYTASENSGSSPTYQWKPLKYVDLTKYENNDDTTWYKSGTWKWNMPDDWTKVDPGDIDDRFWPGGDFETGSQSFSSDEDVSSVSNAVTLNLTHSSAMTKTDFSGGSATFTIASQTGAYALSPSVLGPTANETFQIDATVNHGGIYGTHTVEGYNINASGYEVAMNYDLDVLHAADFPTDSDFPLSDGLSVITKSVNSYGFEIALNVTSSNFDSLAELDAPLYNYDDLPGGISLPVNDGFAVVQNATASNVVGKYFTFTSSTTDYYVWFRQAATREKSSFEFNLDASGEFGIICNGYCCFCSPTSTKSTSTICYSIR